MNVSYADPWCTFRCCSNSDVRMYFLFCFEIEFLFISIPSNRLLNLCNKIKVRPQNPFVFNISGMFFSPNFFPISLRHPVMTIKSVCYFNTFNHLLVHLVLVDKTIHFLFILPNMTSNVLGANNQIGVIVIHFI